MPYIAFELDAIANAGHAAAFLAIPPNSVIGGLVQLWQWCWRNKTDHATTVQVQGVFAPCPEKICDALEAFGFLEKGEESYRVRGASRYLRISENKAKGARATNAVRAQKRRSKNADATQDTRRHDAEPTHRDALSSSIEHLASNIEVKEEDSSPASDSLSGIWNELMAEANAVNPKDNQIALVKELTGKRQARVKARLSEHSLEEWRTCIDRIRQSPFCLGVNERGWRADFDFLLQPDTYAKTMEGKYDARKQQQPKSMTQGMNRGAA